MSQRPLRFVHRSEIVAVADASPTLTVLAWLREHARCTGTKEGCNEGDCGACTVLVGELDAAGAVRLEPVNACIQFLPTLDGKALVTVEDLAGAHPAQAAMVACHGSQCGFCTPGFVMTLAALHQRHGLAGTKPARDEIADELSGNLCRCTGYRPILDAGEQMFAQAAPAIDTTAIAQGLRALQADAALATPGFHAPRSIDALAALCASKPEARLLAGGTDIGLWVNKQFRDLGEVIFLGRVDELKRIEVVDGQLEIGAGASLEAAFAALTAHWPEVREMGLRFASPPIRNAGTMGGNIANGSPIGDSAPVLIALGASLALRRADAQRTLPLEDFYVDYMRNRLEPGEFIQSMRVPMPARGSLLRTYKLSKRYDSDISGLAAGLWLKMDGDIASEARFAFGGMAAIVRRAPNAEAAVRGQRWTEATARTAMAALDLDFKPLSDLRASAGYRRRAAKNLLLRLWLQTRADAPLAEAQSSVWAAA